MLENVTLAAVLLRVVLAIFVYVLPAAIVVTP